MPTSQFRRSYVVVHRPGPADTNTVAALLDAAATQLRQLGPVTVHHLDLDIADDVRAAGVCLTVYYDTQERRTTRR